MAHPAKPSPAPASGIASTVDPVGLTLASVGAGAAGGAAILTFGVLILRGLQGRSGTRDPDVEFLVLSASLVFGILFAVATTVLATRAIRDIWRRSVAGVIAVFTAALLAAVAPLSEVVAGRVGLAIYATALTFATGYLIRVAREAARQ